MPLLFVAGCGGSELAVLELAANPASVAPGKPTTIVYRVANADTVRIDVEGGAPLLERTSAASGSVPTARLFSDTTFVLTAKRAEEEVTRRLLVPIDLDAASIDELTATPMRAAPGVPITVRWQTTNAASGELRIPGRPASAISAGALESGSHFAGKLDRPTTVTMAIRNRSGRELTKELSIEFDGPVIETFTADPNPVRRGRVSRLRWYVGGATRIVVSGNLSGTVATETTPEGFVDVAPRFNELFTLVANDALARTASAAIGLNVTVSRGARVISFEAMPPVIVAGRTSALRWEVENAPGGVEIIEGGRVVTATAAEQGSFIVSPEATATYTLRAVNSTGGDDSDSQTITVLPTGATITGFTVDPNPAAAGSRATVRWTTIGASSVRVLRDAAEIYSTAIDAASGELEVDAGTTNEVFELIATGLGGDAHAFVNLVVHATPRINTLDAMPRTVLGTGQVDVVWNASEVNRLELFANGVPAPGFTPIDNGIGTAPSTGTYTTAISETTLFELIATNAAGSASAQISVARVVVEQEPNEGPGSAMMLGGDGDGVNATIASAIDADWYAVTVPEGEGVFAETSDGAGGCAIDTIMTLYAPDGVTELVADDDDGIPLLTGFGACSRIDWRVDSAARELPAGTYYLRVLHYEGGTGPYTLTTSVDAPGCGNGYVEIGNVPVPEQCDDGNSASGDGCSPSCAIEPLAVISGPNVGRTIAGGIGLLREVDFYELDFLSPGYVRAETFAPVAPDCAGVDTILRLWDESFVELGSNDQDGVFSCSLIDPGTDAFAAVGAGRYYVSVEDFGGDELIGQYTLQLTLIGAGCGNGFLESGESCDDSNNLPADGCDAQCQLEGIVEQESLGNDDYSAPGVRVAGANTTFAGAIFPSTDFDWYAVAIPQGSHLEAYTSVGAIDDCPSEPGPRARLTLFAPDGHTVLATSSSGGPNDSCGRISPATVAAAFDMDAGTYYLRVDEHGQDSTIGAYFLFVSVLAPGCANGVRDLGEQCEDGNTIAGDGCSASCAFEVRPGIISPPGGSIAVAITPASFTVVQIQPSRAGQAIDAVAADVGGTTCNGIATRLELYDASFSLIGGSDQFGPSGSAGSCAAIRYDDDLWGTDLTGGSYYLAIFDDSPGGGITELRVNFHDPACGNRLVETNAGEQCDDGNTAGGDGCSTACRFEPLSTLMLPTSGPMTIAGAISVAGQLDVYSLAVADTSYLIAETFAPSEAAGCAAADTYLVLYDAAGVELGSDNQDGINSCSRISFVDPFALLAPGNYLLAVRDFGDDQAIAAYELVVEGRPALICGNGVLEGGEACDDNNLAGGDGCSPACMFEGTPPIVEVEPNDSATAVHDLGELGQPALQDLSGSIGALGDEDWFSFTVPGLANVNAAITTFGLPGSLSSCGFDTQVWLYDGVPGNLIAQNPGGAEPTLVAYDNDDGFGSCSQINGTEASPIYISIAPGTYYLRVRAFNNASVIPQYFTRIDLR